MAASGFSISQSKECNDPHPHIPRWPSAAGYSVDCAQVEAMSGADWRQLQEQEEEQQFLLLREQEVKLKGEALEIPKTDNEATDCIF